MLLLMDIDQKTDKRVIDKLNKKFEGVATFDYDGVVHYHRLYEPRNPEKEVKKVIEVAEELNNLKYDHVKHPYIGGQLQKINDILKMKRLDMKTGWIINEIWHLYAYIEMARV